MKSLDRAVADGDVIRGIIRNTGSNQDGNTPGITLPSSASQESLIRRLYTQAGLNLADTTYVEAHGTGTAAGDPIEASALGATFGAARAKGDPLYIGSVKSNVGHLESSSAITQVIKSIMMIEKGLIPPSIRFENPNPRIPMLEWNLKVPTELIQWPCSALRRISINSFGYGGTNAHCILDDAYHYLKTYGLSGKHNVQGFPPLHPKLLDYGISDNYSKDNGQENLVTTQTAAPKLLVWTSLDEAGLKRTGSSYSTYIAEKETEKLDEKEELKLLSDLAYTLAFRRSRFPWKSFAISRRLEDAAEMLQSSKVAPVRSAEAQEIPRICFVFTGQGAQWHAMGRELLAYPTFKRSLEMADAHFAALGAEWSLIAELLRDRDSSKLDRPELSQPACTALQLAMVDLLKGWGIVATAVVGHSSGEIAAAYCKGALTSKQAWAIAYHRGRLASSMKEMVPDIRGAMLACGLGAEEATEYIKRLPDSSVTVACVNSPSSTTLSGDSKAIDKMATLLNDDGHFARKLKVGVAYHSPHMQLIAAPYLQALGKIDTPAIESTVTMVSSVTGMVVENCDLESQYWVDNLTSPVLFTDAVQSMIAEVTEQAGGTSSALQLIEIGPHSALQGPIRQILDAKGIKNVFYDSVIQRNVDAAETALNVVGKLFQVGYPVDLAAINKCENEDGDSQMLVDLPPFAWKHDTKHWFESSQSLAHRFRQHPRTDFLGAETPELLQHEPRFRNFIRPAEVPWVYDHKIHGSTLYPAASMLIAAIEAMAQKSDPGKDIEGYELRDININKAIVVPSQDEADTAVEILLTLSPARSDSEAPPFLWHRFRLYSRRDTWELNCSGLICLKYKELANPLFADEKIHLNRRYDEKYNAVRSNCTKIRDAAWFYEQLHSIGMQYGTTFQTLTDINKGEFESSCTLTIPATSSIMPDQFEFGHIIHPATLDGFLHMALSALSSADKDLEVAQVPTSIKRVYISASLPKDAGCKLHGYAQAVNGICGVAVSSETWEEPLAIFEGVRMTVVPGQFQTDAFQEILKSVATSHWKQDWSLLSPQQLTQLCSDTIGDTGIVDRQVLIDLEMACFIFIKRVMQECSPTEAEGFAWNFKLYYEYMRRCYERGLRGQLAYQTEGFNWSSMDKATEDSLLKRVAETTSDGMVLVAQGHYLPQILRGEIPPLQILMKDDMLEKVYRTGLDTKRHFAQLSFCADLLAHKAPDMKILEIGAGTGGATLPIMQILSEGDGMAPRFAHYTYTDISLGHFEKAAEKFAQWTPWMTFAKLNIEEDPMSQGFEEGGYDLVVAAGVLHATRSIEQTMINLRRLLKPTGKLLLSEPTSDIKMRYHMIVGSLEGWWYGRDDGRMWTPHLSIDSWDTVLRKTGYSGVDVKFENFDNEVDTGLSVMVASATPSTTLAPPDDVVIVVPVSPLNETTHFSDKFKKHLASLGSTVSVATLAETVALDLSEKSCLCLFDIGETGGFLADTSHSDWAAFKRLVLTSRSTAYITRGATVESGNPFTNMMHGVARCVRSENPGLCFGTVDVEQSAIIDSEDNISAVVNVLSRVHHNKTAERPEWEFLIRGGMPEVLRYGLDKQMCNYLRESRSGPRVERGLLHDTNRSLKLEIGTPGRLETLRYNDGLDVTKPLLHDEVDIEVRAAGLNFMDVMAAMGQLPQDDLGADCSGIIRRVGSSVAHFKPGDRVLAAALGSFANVVRTAASAVQLLPDSIDFDTAAALPVAYMTAYRSLYEVANLQKDEVVLVHSAAGGVGQAAINLARHRGATVIATVSSEPKKALLMETFGIPESHIFDSRGSSFAAGVMRLTNGRGADVVLNSLAGEALSLSWNCIARFGRFIELVKRDILVNASLDMAPFLRNASFHGVNLLEYVTEDVDPTAFPRIFSAVMDLVHAGVATPIEPTTTMPFSEVESAFRLMQGGQHMGKIVLKAEEGDLVPLVRPSLRSALFNEEGTYIIAGGGGGLGRAMAAWMSKLGARNIILLSRSGDKKAEVRELLTQLGEQGVRVAAWECDISKERNLMACVERCNSESWPRIRGVIQAVMVLDDTVRTCKTKVVVKMY